MRIHVSICVVAGLARRASRGAPGAGAGARAELGSEIYVPPESHV